MNNISINEYDDTCKDCPDRKVGCHNIKTCAKWAEHEKKKEKTYARRLQESTLFYIEQQRVRRCYKSIEAKRH